MVAALMCVLSSKRLKLTARILLKCSVLLQRAAA
jgi:hypothetical protein